MNSFGNYFDAKILKKYYLPRQEKHITRSGFLWLVKTEVPYTVHEWFIDCSLVACDDIILKIPIKEEQYERLDVSKASISVHLNCEYDYHSICFHDDKKDHPLVIEVKNERI